MLGSACIGALMVVLVAGEGWATGVVVEGGGVPESSAFCLRRVERST